MNKEGFWINWQTGGVFPVDDHELWIRRDNNAEQLGVPKTVQRRLKEFQPRTDRTAFLLEIFRSAPVIRVRGHGHYFTFEFVGETPGNALLAIWWFCRSRGGAGPLTGLRIVNFYDNTCAEMNFEAFDNSFAANDINELVKPFKKFDFSEENKKLLIGNSVNSEDV